MKKNINIKNMNKNYLSEAIRLLRVYNDMSQTELSAKIGFFKPVISNMEKSKRTITLQTLQDYSDVFGISVQDIITFAEKLQQEPELKKNIFDMIMSEVRK